MELSPGAHCCLRPHCFIVDECFRKGLSRWRRRVINYLHANYWAIATQLNDCSRLNLCGGANSLAVEQRPVTRAGIGKIPVFAFSPNLRMEARDHRPACPLKRQIISDWVTPDLDRGLF